MSSSNRRAGIKVSGLVAAGKVQVQDMPADTPHQSPAERSSNAVSGEGLVSVAAGPESSPVAAQQSSEHANADGATLPARTLPANDQAVAPGESLDIVKDSSTAGSATSVEGARNVKMIPTDLVVDSPYQPRLQYDPEEIDRLAETMSNAKQGEPIRVRLKNGKYELISGHRRIRAARTLGWTQIAAEVEELTDKEAQAKTMVLAIGSVKLTDYELAKMFRTAIDDGICKNQVEAASYFGVGKTKVNGCLDILKLPRSITRFLDARPGLFGFDTAIVIKKLYAEYPNSLPDIERGVQRLTEGATQSSLKAWVLQAIKGQGGSSTTETNLITRGRRLVFTTKVDAEKRAIQVNCKIPDLDIVALEKDLQAWLDERAKALSPDTEEPGSEDSGTRA